MGSAVFRGSNEINMDTKGRMAMPARYRDVLAATCNNCLVATIDTQEQCLFMYPLPVWEGIEAQIGGLSTFNPDTRRLQHLLIGHARDLELDGSGRILIPTELRAYAQLDKKIMLVGQNHRLELWNLDIWNSRRETWLKEAAGELVIPPEIQSLSL
tara:strand:+ start:4279 stop:4746 length:468 start_codon:yes stop_codon:yes gene_type:complete